MEHCIEIPTLRSGVGLLRLLKKRLPRLSSGSAFTFGEPRLKDGCVVVEFDLDEEALVAWALQNLLKKQNVDLIGMGLSAFISRVGKPPTKKKAAPRKRAAKAKAK